MVHSLDSSCIHVRTTSARTSRRVPADACNPPGSVASRVASSVQEAPPEVTTPMPPVNAGNRLTTSYADQSDSGELDT